MSQVNERTGACDEGGRMVKAACRQPKGCPHPRAAEQGPACILYKAEAPFASTPAQMARRPASGHLICPACLPFHNCRSALLQCSMVVPRAPGWLASSSHKKRVPLRAIPASAISHTSRAATACSGMPSSAADVSPKSALV